MNKLVSTKNLTREEWLKFRKNGIGGSDAAAVCGMNPYSSAMKVYYDKICDTVEEQSNESIRQGNDLEDYVAQRFMEATGLKVRRSNYIYQNSQYPFMIADVDRMVVGEDAGLECKTASAYNADKWKDGEIPLHYIIQCYHYMAVTGKRTWYIAAVILGKEFVYRKLEWDDGIIDKIIEHESDFWINHVVKRIIPEPDGSKVCNSILDAYFNSAIKSSSIELVGFDDKLKRREEIMAVIEELQQEQNQIEQEVKLYMKDNENAVSDSYRVSWSNVETTRLDTKRIKQEMPQVYNDYAKTSLSRRFQIKAA